MIFGQTGQKISVRILGYVT